jgi:hypothetical protein
MSDPPHLHQLGKLPYYIFAKTSTVKLTYIREN